MNKKHEKNVCLFVLNKTNKLANKNLQKPFPDSVSNQKCLFCIIFFQIKLSKICNRKSSGQTLKSVQVMTEFRRNF